MLLFTLLYMALSPLVPVVGRSSSTRKTLNVVNLVLPGFILFTVHELGYGEMPRAVVFRGTRELQKAEVQVQLGLHPAPGGHMHPRAPGLTPRAGAAGGVGRYLLSVGEHDFALESAIEDLQVRNRVQLLSRVQGPRSAADAPAEQRRAGFEQSAWVQSTLHPYRMLAARNVDPVLILGS